MTTINDQLKLAATHADLNAESAQLLQDFFLKLATPQQKDQLDGWINQREANSHFFDLLLELNREGTGAATLQVLNQYKQKPKRKVNWIKRILLYPVYAYLLLSVVDAFLPGGPFKQLLKGRPLAEINWTRITTSTQEQALTFYLSDSTLVELLPHSSLVYPAELNPMERAVVLQGSARFIVKKRPGEPFKVEGSKTFASCTEGEFLYKQVGEQQASLSTSRGYVSFGYDSYNIWGVEPNQRAFWMPDMISLETPIEE
jgi:ferric-dicitrate binding protein FerR (iron transport regulator)